MALQMTNHCFHFHTESVITTVEHDDRKHYSFIASCIGYFMNNTCNGLLIRISLYDILL